MVWLIPGKLFKVRLFSVTSYFLILFISNCCVPTLPFKTERSVCQLCTKQEYSEVYIGHASYLFSFLDLVRKKSLWKNEDIYKYEFYGKRNPKS